MFILLHHLGLPTGAAIVVSVIMIKVVKAALARRPLSGPGTARDRHGRGPQR
jgi:hypothetical protein